MYLATIDRIRSGEPYYAALGDGLRGGNYPTTPVFNWRTPAHFMLVATLSVPTAALLLQFLAFAALLLTAYALGRESVPVLILGVLAQMGALATAFRPAAVSMPEVWAGVTIALSIAAYCKRWWMGGAALGIASVFLRELAAPYCVACAAVAIGRRRSRETALWVAGGLGYLAYFAIHVTRVWAHQLPGDIVQIEPWLRWNGLVFTVSTVGMNGWLGPAPFPIRVLFIVLGLAGTVSSRIPRHVSLPLLAYFLVFAFAGQPFNYYWGFVTAPIWALAVAYGPDGLASLVRSARRRTGGSR